MAHPRISYLMARLDRVIRRLSEKRLRPYGLSATAYTTLTVIREHQGLSNAQLARRAHVSPQAMNQVLADLERRDFIDRRTDSTHMRILRTTLTPEGIRTLALCDEEVDELEAMMLERLDADQQEHLRAYLIECVRALGAGLASTEQSIDLVSNAPRGASDPRIELDGME